MSETLTERAKLIAEVFRREVRLVPFDDPDDGNEYWRIAPAGKGSIDYCATLVDNALTSSTPSPSEPESVSTPAS